MGAGAGGWPWSHPSKPRGTWCPPCLCLSTSQSLVLVPKLVPGFFLVPMPIPGMVPVPKPIPRMMPIPKPIPMPILVPVPVLLPIPIPVPKPIPVPMPISKPVPRSSWCWCPPQASPIARASVHPQAHPWAVAHPHGHLRAQPHGLRRGCPSLAGRGDALEGLLADLPQVVLVVGEVKASAFAGIHLAAIIRGAELGHSLT